MFGKIGKLVRFAGIVLIVLILVVTFRGVFWPPSATADLGSGRTIEMILSPMSGFHSDFERKFVINSKDYRIDVHVADDIGWWRATPLYQAEDGRFILIDYAVHDILFCEKGITVDPPSYNTNGSVLYIPGRSNIEACSGMGLLEDAPAAQHWRDFGKWRYIGIFLHPRKDQPFAFKSWRELPEPSPDTYDYGG